MKVTPEFNEMREAMQRVYVARHHYSLSNKLVNDMIRAALLSIREPTEGMVKNAAGFNELSRQRFVMSHRAAIDYIRGERE